MVKLVGKMIEFLSAEGRIRAVVAEVASGVEVVSFAAFRVSVVRQR
jgi:hypothetical protein